MGDLVDAIDDVLAGLPGGVTPVVFHSAALGYVGPPRRAVFAERVMAHPEVLWISNEGPGVVETLTTTLVPPVSAETNAFFVVGVGGSDVVGISDPHGRWLRWSTAS